MTEFSATVNKTTSAVEFSISSESVAEITFTLTSAQAAVLANLMTAMSEASAENARVLRSQRKDQIISMIAALQYELDDITGV